MLAKGSANVDSPLRYLPVAKRCAVIFY